MANVIGELELPSLNSISDLADDDDDDFVHCLDDGDHANDDFLQCSILMAFSVSLVIYVLSSFPSEGSLLAFMYECSQGTRGLCTASVMAQILTYFFLFSFSFLLFFHPGTIIYQNKHCETALNPGIPDMSWSVRVW